MLIFGRELAHCCGSGFGTNCSWVQKICLYFPQCGGEWTMELRPTFSEVFFFSSSVLSLLLKCIKKVHSGWTPIYLILLRFMIVCHICSSSWPLNTLVLIMRRTLGNFFSPYFAVPQYWLISLQIQFLVLLSPIVCLLTHFLTSFSQEHLLLYRQTTNLQLLCDVVTSTWTKMSEVCFCHEELKQSWR